MRTRIYYAGFLSLLTLLSVWFIWPIYQDIFLFVTVGVSLAVGFGLGALKASKRISGLTLLLATLGAFLLLALPLSNPRALSSQSTWLSGLIEALGAPIQSWKQIITIELPLGTYHALLSPALVLYLISGILFGWIYFSKITRFWLASLPVLAIVIFAISFGVSSVPGEFSIFSLRFPVETPIVTGSVLFVVLVIYLNWGARAARRDALLVKPESLGFTTNLALRKMGRTITALAVVLSATIGTSLVMQLGGISSNRVVLRTGIEQVKRIQNQVSPLSGYRMYFNDSDLLTSTLLSYSVDGSTDRIRIATMPYYDGETFTVAPTNNRDIDSNSMFSRLPYELPATLSGSTQQFSINVEKLGSIWIPAVSGTRKITFTGTNASALADHLFVNRNTLTSAIIPGESDGASYLVTYNEGQQVNAADILPSSASIREDLIPEQLVAWLEAQKDIGISDGTGMVAIAKRLRDRGYLSHSLISPVSVENQSTWMTLIEQSNFEKSTAGHNQARINNMFKDLLTKQEQSSGKNLVATAGDDEQFATAIALIAAAKGFPSRVVIGFRTGQAGAIEGIPNCSEDGELGVCTGANLAAWAEIQGSNGQWLAIDATPQFELPLSLTTPPQGDPERPTSAGEDSAEVLPPSKASPSTTGECAKNPKACEQKVDWWQSLLEFFQIYVLPALQWILLVSIFVAPFAIVLLMKRRRIKSRRNHEVPYARIVGAWEEYVDRAVDFGAPLPRQLTRLEYARITDSKDLEELAQMANMIAFGSAEDMSVDFEENEVEDLVARSWQIFDAEVTLLSENAKFASKLRAKLSLRSFMRSISPKIQLSKLRSSLQFGHGSKLSDGSSIRALIAAMRKLRPKKPVNK